MSDRPRVLAIVGPTGTGKTELVCALARRTGAEVIGCDSMQVYRGMDIGTAKPSRALRAEIPHHGIDIAAPDEPMSAGSWAQRARRAAAEIHERGRRAILCGGTGLYARAFAGGLIRGAESDPALRHELEARSTASLVAELRSVDRASAERISPGDRVRLVRALEIARLCASPASAVHERHDFRDRPFDVRWLALDLERGELWQRLRARVDEMFDAGLAEELRELHGAGYTAELRPLRSIGYRQAGRLLAGEISEAEARDATWLATRRYAKRQRTWFRAEPGVRWLDAAEPGAALARALEELE